jgi:hypothetical protein
MQAPGAHTCHSIHSFHPLTTYPLVHTTGCRRQLRLLANNKQAEAETKGKNAAPGDGSAAARQMLGMKGAADETDIWKIRVQLTKPVTWVPLIWGECSCCCWLVSPPGFACMRVS